MRQGETDMSQLQSNGTTSIGKILLGIVVAVVGLWLAFAVILPLIKSLVSILLTIAVFGAVVWVVYKVVTYDADKKS
jgi:uncharacterized membrane protein YeaQ/YmgE (transglycosylase-associated protein family)